MATQPAQGFNAGSLFSDLWDTGLQTFQRWVDHEIGADIAIESENRADAAAIDASQAPVADHTAVAGFNVMTLALVGGAALVLLLLFRR